MFGKKYKVRELQRDCRQCGNRWFVPFELGSDPKGKRSIAMAAAGERMQSGGSRRGSSSANSIRQATMAQQQLAVTQARRCPACGSSAFSQREVVTDTRVVPK